MSFRPFRDELSRMWDVDTAATIHKREFRRKTGETVWSVPWCLAGRATESPGSIGLVAQLSQLPDNGTMIEARICEAKVDHRVSRCETMVRATPAVKGQLEPASSDFAG